MSSPSLYVIGFRLPDEKWRKMKAVYDVCKQSGVDPPAEVEDFFDDNPPDDRGILVELDGRFGAKGHECCVEYKGDMEDGWEIDLSKVPKDLTHLRFVASY